MIDGHQKGSRAQVQPIREVSSAISIVAKSPNIYIEAFPTNKGTLYSALEREPGSMNLYISGEKP
jgi:hypothetical protein